jgi:hypothetical protein
MADFILVYSTFPTILNYFIGQRKRFLKAQDLNVHFSADFAFFSILHRLVDEQIDKRTISETALLSLLKTSAALLNCLAMHDVYRINLDDVSKQQLSYLQTYFNVMIDRARTVPSRFSIFHLLKRVKLIPPPHQSKHLYSTMCCRTFRYLDRAAES